MRSLFLALLLAACDGSTTDNKSDTDFSDTEPVDPDSDGDGDSYTTAEGDCDDQDAAVHPGADELCNGEDDDCDDEVDEDGIDGPLWYPDSDDDRYGAAQGAVSACTAPAGYVADDQDCDDNADSRFPGASELCNEVDDDCDELVDEDAVDAPAWYPDGDDDGYGVPGVTVEGCTQPAGYAATDDDCDDALAAVNPGAIELCNDRDDDCDDDTDSDAVDQTTWYYDADGDQFGIAPTAQIACDAPPEFVADAGDCDDGEATIFPGAPERCNGIDNDCDGVEQSPDPVDGDLWYADADSDDYGVDSTAVRACTGPPGHVEEGGDCNDGNALVNPAADEVCGGGDEDCSGAVDDNPVNVPTYYLDLDNDSYGAIGSDLRACSPPAGYRTRGGDCDDGDSTIRPGAVETCDGVDENCNELIDENPVGGTLYYPDDDGDTYGVTADAQRFCEVPEGWVEVGGDCAELDPAIFPGAPDVPCNGLDDDCDPATMEPGVATVGGVSGTLAEAVALLTGDGDDIHLCEGIYQQPEIALPYSVAIVGDFGAAVTHLVGDGSAGVLYLPANERLDLSGVTVRGGVGHLAGGARRGGAIYAEAGFDTVVALADVVLTDNRAEHGGAVWLGDDGTLDLRRSELSDNRATGSPTVSSGGAITVGDGVRVELGTETLITGNEAGLCGGIEAGDDVSLLGGADVVIGNNHADLEGGGLCLGDGGLLTYVTVRFNSSDGVGGGMVTKGPVVVEDSAFHDNEAGLSGGGISASWDLTLDRVRLENNEAGIDGGGVKITFDRSTATLTDCVVVRNRALFFAADAGGVLVDRASLVSVDTEWGAGSTNNTPGDVGLEWGNQAFQYAGVQSFSCVDLVGGGGGCGP